MNRADRGSPFALYFGSKTHPFKISSLPFRGVWSPFRGQERGSNSNILTNGLLLSPPLPNLQPLGNRTDRHGGFASQAADFLGAPIRNPPRLDKFPGNLLLAPHCIDRDDACGKFKNTQQFLVHFQLAENRVVALHSSAHHIQFELVVDAETINQIKDPHARARQNGPPFFDILITIELDRQLAVC
jgi:hypothetical protein